MGNPNFIEVIDDFLSPELCARMIEKLKADPRLRRDAPQIIGSRDYRDAASLNITPLPEWKEEDAAIFQAVDKAAAAYLQKHGFRTQTHDTGYTLAEFEPGAVTKSHIDSFHGIASLRLISLVLYLNTIDEGGETVFPKYGKAVKPVAGRAVLFPPFYTHRHYSNPAPNDRRYIMVTWIMSDIELLKKQLGIIS